MPKGGCILGGGDLVGGGGLTSKVIWSATAIILSTVGTGAWHLVSSPGRTFVWSNSYVNSLEVQTFLGLVINRTGHLPTHTIGHEYNQSKYRNRIDKLIANCGRARPVRLIIGPRNSWTSNTSFT